MMMWQTFPSQNTNGYLSGWVSTQLLLEDSDEQCNVLISILLRQLRIPSALPTDTHEFGLRANTLLEESSWIFKWQTNFLSHWQVVYL
jgi:hypothetical protein